MAEAGKTLYLISTLASWTFKCTSKKTMQLCLLTKTDFFLSKNSKICKTPKDGLKNLSLRTSGMNVC